MQRITIRSRPKQSVKIRSHLIAPTDDVIVVAKTITENGFYNAKDENAKAYNPVRVEVPTFEEENAELTVENSQLKADIIVKNQQIAELEQGVGEAFENGRKAEYDRFWDSFQNNGSRTDYHAGFSGEGWNDTTLKPKHRVNVVGNGESVFNSSLITTLPDNIDFSQCTNFYYMFAFCEKLLELRKIDMSKGTSPPTYMFRGCGKLHTIQELVVSASTSFATNSFNGCTALTHLTILGTIAKNNFAIQSATKLTRNSIASIINALSTTTSGLTVTLSKTAKEAAFSEEDWTTLVATKPNWNIVLA